jgi:hypothetical protein
VNKKGKKFRSMVVDGDEESYHNQIDIIRQGTCTGTGTISDQARQIAQLTAQLAAAHVTPEGL